MEADKLMEKNLIVVFLFLKSITISIHFNNYALQNKHLLHRLQRKKLIYMFSFNRVSIDKKNLETKNKITSFTFKIKIYIPFDQ